MASYGAKYIQWAPFAETAPDESAEAYPKYGDPINLGALQKATDSPSYNEAKIYGDDALDEYVSEFKECPIDVEITELSNAVASAVTGAQIDSSGDKDLHFNSSDEAPYGGMAFFVKKMVHKKVVYQGIYYPKLKATMQGEEFNTKGDSITLAGGKLHFLASTCAKGDWKVKSDDLATEAAAKTWVDGKIKKAAG
uniref:Tail tube protein n=1 Tax=Siphoviridae sp. ctEqU3 TaxID=2825399 RepID=A0A8S5P312_9CAUD|nr:MAG TPA: tail tube protein [Siphoviridae sp. ctEqU3]